jgi:hypothetical protein
MPADAASPPLLTCSTSRSPPGARVLAVEFYLLPHQIVAIVGIEGAAKILLKPWASAAGAGQIFG